MSHYVCEGCGNKLDAAFAEETWEGPTGPVVVRPWAVECRSDKHSHPFHMKRVEGESDE